LLKGTVR
jgi:hypothetical protein